MSAGAAVTAASAPDADGAPRGNRRLCWLLCLMAVWIALWPDALDMLAYDRQRLLQGQGWRLLSAHLVHLNQWHLLMNLAGLVLLYELLWWRLPARHVAGVLLASAATVLAGLWLGMPELQRYAGLSGALHGLWAGSALLLLWSRGGTATGAAKDPAARAGWALAMLLLAGKLLAETAGGPHPAAGMIGGTVVTQAHAWGALGGIVYAVTARCMRKNKIVRGSHPLLIW